MKAEELAKELDQKYRRSMTDGQKTRPVYSNSSSELGHPCMRYLYLNRVAWREKPKPGETLCHIFNEGRIHEREVKAKLMTLGFNLERAEMTLEWKEHNITGHDDTIIVDRDGAEHVGEIKGLAAQSWQKLKTLEDMRNSKTWYIKKYPTQIALYIYMSDSADGIFILKNKGTGQIRFIPVEKEEVQDLVDEAVLKAKEINKWVEAWPEPTEGMMLPPEIPWEYEAACDRCPFNKRCQKEYTSIDKMSPSELNALEEVIGEMEECKGDRDRYEELNNYRKKLIQGCEPGKYQVGNVRILVYLNKKGQTASRMTWIEN